MKRRVAAVAVSSWASSRSNASASGRSSSGSGLGLAVVRSAAARIGASVTLEDAAPGLIVRLRF